MLAAMSAFTEDRPVPPILETTPPVEREIAAAVQSQRVLAAYLWTQVETQRIQIFDEKNGRTRSTYRRPPAPADVGAGGGQRRQGGANPCRADDSEGAADMLNVSRPHLVKLLATGVLLAAHRGLRRLRRLSRSAERLPDMARPVRPG